MRVGGYSLDLYCDRYNVKPGKVVDHLGHRYDEFPAQFFGETGVQCDKQARRLGWSVGPTRVLCPRCNHRRRRPPTDTIIPKPSAGGEG